MSDFIKTRIARILKAVTFSMQGFKFALKQRPIQDELIACAVLAPIAIYVDVTTIERLMLLGSLFLVILAEVFNTAIEVVIDRISTEQHPLSGAAKDLGSAAVFLCIAWACIVWAYILWPVLVS